MDKFTGLVLMLGQLRELGKFLFKMFLILILVAVLTVIVAVIFALEGVNTITILFISLISTVAIGFLLVYASTSLRKFTSSKE